MAEGSTFVSRLKVLQLRPDPDEPNGDWITSCVIEPMDAEAKQNTQKQAQPGTKTQNAPKDKWRSSRLRKALLNALATSGTDINPFPDGPKLRGVLLQTVRDEFSRAYPADGETEKLRWKAIGEAWRRELKEFSNPEHPCIGVWESKGQKWVWAWLITPELQSSAPEIEDKARRWRPHKPHDPHLWPLVIIVPGHMGYNSHTPLKRGVAVVWPAWSWQHPLPTRN
jgi:hypothetical protein